jgi:hypothetical protein
MSDMRRWTPQEIVNALYESDQELSTLSKQLAWFKGQRDHWKSKMELYRASAATRYNGPATKAKDFSVDASSRALVQIPWIDEPAMVSLPEMVRLTDSSFDLISTEYNRLETHIMILMAVNKNVMQDFATSNYSYRE